MTADGGQVQMGSSGEEPNHVDQEHCTRATLQNVPTHTPSSKWHARQGDDKLLTNVIRK